MNTVVGQRCGDHFGMLLDDCVALMPYEGGSNAMLGAIIVATVIYTNIFNQEFKVFSLNDLNDFRLMFPSYE